MKRVTYNIIKHIPLSDKTFDPILVYMRKHPDIVLTEKLAKQILKK